jgi:cold shock protein
MSTPATLHGTVKWFDSRKGYGFITVAGDSRNYFVHWSLIEGKGYRRLEEGEPVTFQPLHDLHKGWRATAVKRTP